MWLQAQVITGPVGVGGRFQDPVGADADQMLDHLCERPIIFKTRYTVPHLGHTWEVDDFHLENAGLIVAEVELSDQDEWFAKPAWIGEEVTGDPRYFNANLIAHPYSDWAE